MLSKESYTHKKYAPCMISFIWSQAIYTMEEVMIEKVCIDTFWDDVNIPSWSTDVKTE